MTFKELKDKYKGYDIIAFGRPLKQQTIPFTFLPKDKKLEECEVIDYKVEDKEYIQYGVSFKTMKPIKPKKIKGNVYCYVK